MRENNIFISILLICTISTLINCEKPKERLCANTECKEPISLARTLNRYSAASKDEITFAPNKYARVLSKNYNKNDRFWGVEIGGRFGYVPKQMLQEEKIYVKTSNLILVTSDVSEESVKVDSREQETAKSPDIFEPIKNPITEVAGEVANKEIDSKQNVDVNQKLESIPSLEINTETKNQGEEETKEPSSKTSEPVIDGQNMNAEPRQTNIENSIVEDGSNTSNQTIDEVNDKPPQNDTKSLSHETSYTPAKDSDKEAPSEKLKSLDDTEDDEDEDDEDEDEEEDDDGEDQNSEEDDIFAIFNNSTDAKLDSNDTFPSNGSHISDVKATETEVLTNTTVETLPVASETPQPPVKIETIDDTVPSPNVQEQQESKVEVKQDTAPDTPVAKEENGHDPLEAVKTEVQEEKKEIDLVQSNSPEVQQEKKEDDTVLPGNREVEQERKDVDPVQAVKESDLVLPPKGAVQAEVIPNVQVVETPTNEVEKVVEPVQAVKGSDLVLPPKGEVQAEVIPNVQVPETPTNAVEKGVDPLQAVKGSDLVLPPKGEVEAEAIPSGQVVETPTNEVENTTSENFTNNYEATRSQEILPEEQKEKSGEQLSTASVDVVESLTAKPLDNPDVMTVNNNPEYEDQLNSTETLQPESLDSSSSTIEPPKYADEPKTDIPIPTPLPLFRGYQIPPTKPTAVPSNEAQENVGQPQAQENVDQPEQEQEQETEHTTALPETFVEPLETPPEKEQEHFETNHDETVVRDASSESVESKEPVTENANDYNVATSSEQHQAKQMEPSESLETTRDETESENVPEYEISFFEQVMNYVRSFWPETDKPISVEINEDQETINPNLEQSADTSKNEVEDGYCEKVSPNSCPTTPTPGARHAIVKNLHNDPRDNCVFQHDYIELFLGELIENSNLVFALAVVSLTLLILIFGHYCINNRGKEYKLVSKLNTVERSLLASIKEASFLKHELIETKNKLESIENSSFGSNDMVISLKEQIKESEEEKMKLEEQIHSLEKELETVVAAGTELNGIVADLLNSQSGDDYIISSVEDLQKQLNEQENTIQQINAILAEKSRENSELQLLIAEQRDKLETEVGSVRKEKEDLEKELSDTKLTLEQSDEDHKLLMSKLSQRKEEEISQLKEDLRKFKKSYDEMSKKWQSCDARVEVLQKCLNDVTKDPKFNPKEFMEVANLKADLLGLERERDSLKERLEGELDARKLLEDHVKIVSEEVSSLKQNYSQSEKEKLEAQTRLEVLSNYFKEKETQLQKELSVKESMWLQQQGEKTNTVEMVKGMQDEIQVLKSQNDALRAEIEAQTATYKAQISSLENRAHEAWLATKQTERKLEESRSEAGILRRKLTTMATNSINSISNDPNLPANRLNNLVDGIQPPSMNSLNSAPSPIHMETPGSPLLSAMPPPPMFIPPFLPPPHAFLPIPPPAHLPPPGEMRPPPLGRLMSPPPMPTPNSRYTELDDRGRYSPDNESRYSPDRRYHYNTDIMSATYDTETDLSPPPSPRARSNGSGSGYSNRSLRDRDRDRDRESDRDRNRNPDRNRDRDRDHDSDRDRNSDRERERGGRSYVYSPTQNSERNKKSKTSSYWESDDDYEPEW